MKKLFLVLVVLIQSQLCFSIELTIEAQHALDMAIQSGYYEISILSKKDKDFDQAVILVGEVHVLSESASKIGQNLVEQFNLIGIEGYPEFQSNNDSYLEKAGKIYQSALYWTYGKLRYWNSKYYLSPILSAATKFNDEFIDRPSIERTLISNLFAYEKEGVTERIAPTPVGSLPACDLKSFYESIGLSSEYLISTDSFKNDLVHRIRAKLFSDKLDLVLLEAFDPKPVRMRNYDKIMGATLLTTALAGVTYFTSDYVPDLLETGIYTAAATGIVGTMTGLLEGLLPNHIQVDLGPFNPAKQERNFIMAHRIHNALQLRPNAKVMLVLVGYRHVPDMVKILKETYGFEADVSLQP